MVKNASSLLLDSAGTSEESLQPQPAPISGRLDVPASEQVRAIAEPAATAFQLPIDPAQVANRAPLYIGVRAKFVFALTVSIAWFAGTTWLALPWLEDLGALVGVGFAIAIIGGIALVPGFMNAFLVTSLLVDRRPPRRQPGQYPRITVLIAAYNEEGSIADTLKSLASQDYPADIEVFVIDDGSRDRTAAIVAEKDYPWLHLLCQPRNLGKSAALNRGLAQARHELVVTVDADSYLRRDALRNLVERYLSDPPGTRAVAGTMLVRNSRKNWVTQTQEWDYFHGIAAIKRVQSLYQGTMVAQGAFSIYDREALRQVGGWKPCVGEDIVLTWALLQAGWRVGHAEDACCFTNAPETVRQLVRQRQRWARGMMEAFRQCPGILISPRLSTLFVWWNVLFPWLDLVYTVCFIPGLVLALFGIYWIAGPLTLALLPMALLVNLLMYRVGSRMFVDNRLKVRHNPVGFLIYAFAYSLILQPACVAGYFSELLGLRKSWGTK